MSFANATPSETKLSSAAQEFIPSNRNYSCKEKSNLESVPSYSVLDITDTAMMQLFTNPETFFEVVNPLTDSLLASITDEATLEAVVQHIFRQCIILLNYQYTGARLCSVLAQKLNLSFKVGNFRQLLLKECHMEYSKQEELCQTINGLQELIGFTLFFAELMLNLNLFEVLAPKLSDLLLKLLSQPNDETVKCVNKVLKLTGSALESADEGKLSEIFWRIKDIIIKAETSQLLRAILLSLVSLRAQKWEPDSGSSVTQNGDSTTLPEQEFQDENGETVYVDYAGETEGCDYSNYPSYVPGQFEAEGFVPEEFSGEQCVAESLLPEEFREDYEAWVAAEGNSEQYIEDIPYVIGNDEMDPEMDDAYEQFLAQINPPSSASQK